MSTVTGSNSRGGRAETRGKDKAQSRAPSPGVDESLEDMDPAAQQPKQPTDGSAKKRKQKQVVVTEAVVEEEEEELSADKKKDKEELIFKIRQASSKIYKENGNKQATNEQIAEEIGEDEETVKTSRDSLKLARQGQKLSGHRKSAIKAGFSRRNGASRAELKGLDIEQALIAPSDIARLAHAIPLDFMKGSYDEDEVAMRTELIHEKLPMGAAREIIAFVEPLFRSVMTEAVERQARLKTSRVQPSTMYACLKKYNEHTVMTSVVPPKGLVRFGKEDGVDLVKRGDESKGYLMGVTEEDKKQFKADKKDSKKYAEAYIAAVKAEDDRLAAKKRPAEAEEEAPPAAAVHKKSKKTTAA